MALYVPLLLPASALLNKIGLLPAMLISACLNAIGKINRIKIINK
jgi:hypothetical protein